MSDQRSLLDNATRDLAQFASALRFEDIPPDVIAHVKLCILDGLGASLYGARLPWTGHVRTVVLNEGATPKALLWGTDHKVSVAQAALVNSTAGHGFEMDDIHKESILHPNSLAVPATFALAQGGQAPCSGRDILTAIVAGCEVGLRVGNAATMALFLRGFHPQGTSGAFVSAAASARLAKLTPEQTHQALGIAGSMAAGLMAAQEGAMVKRLHAGRAAQSGILAVQLAQQGFTGIADVLEAGYGGFLSSLSDKPIPAKLTAGLGQVWETANIGFKMYPNVTSIHTALDALRDIMRAHALTGEAIAQIDVQCPHMTYVHTAWPYKPAGITAAQMSMFFGLAAMARDGAVAAGSYTDATVADPQLLAFMPRIAVSESAELEAKGAPFRHACRLSVRSRDGNVFAREILNRRGSPENPVARVDVVEKFRGNVSHLPQDRANRIIDLVERLERLETLDDLFGQLGAA
jgi:2-methylcitrate dehydratase PrpD